MFINSFKRDSNSLFQRNLIISMFFFFLEEKIAVSCSTYVFNISESIIWTGKSEYTTWTMKHSIKMTTEYVEQTFRENQDILEIYHVCVPFKVVTCASMFQTYWRPWDESMHAHWVRPMPKNCYKKEDFPFYNEEMWDYTFQTSFASWYHKKHDAVRTCCLVGIRTQESLDRWRTIHGNNRLNSYHNLMWTPQTRIRFIQCLPYL